MNCSRSLSYSQPMNLFTTDHPMQSQTSCFDRKAHPVLSFVCTQLAIAFMVFPLLFGWLFYELRDFPDETGDQLTSNEVLMLAGLVFVFCSLCAAAIVGIYRLIGRFVRVSRQGKGSKYLSELG